MPTVQRLSLDAFVVATEFLAGAPVFALGDGTVRLVRGEVVESARVHNGAILAAMLSADGRTLITGGDDGKVASVKAVGEIATLAERPKKWVENLAVGRDGAIAFSAGRDAIVRLKSGEERIFTHERSVGGLAFAPKGLRLAVARYNGVSLWWVNAEPQPAELEWKGAHNGITFSPDGRFIVTSMQENALHGWRLEAGTHLRMTGYTAKPRSMSWSAKGRFLATSGADAAIVWPFHFKEGPQGKEPLQLGGRDSLVTRVACHPTEEVVAIGYRDGAVAIGPFDEGDGALLRPPGGPAISALAWDQLGTRLAYGAEDGAAGIVDLKA